MLSSPARLAGASGNASLQGLLRVVALLWLAFFIGPGCASDPSTAPAGPKAVALGGIRIRLHGPHHARASAPPTIVYLTTDRALPVSQNPTRVIEIKREGGRLSPAFSAAAMRQILKFRIVDDIHHRIFSESPVGPFDLGSLGKGESGRVSFDKPGMLRLYCALHPGEDAALFISPSEHFAQVPANGEVVLSGLLPGRYELHTWGEASPRAVVSVEIHPGSVSSIDLRRPGSGGSQ